MPGRISDELRRITRAQGGGQVDPPAEPVSEAARKRGPWIALLILLVVAGGGWLVIDRLMTMSKLQDCVMSGKKNCAPLEVDTQGK